MFKLRDIYSIPKLKTYLFIRIFLEKNQIQIKNKQEFFIVVELLYNTRSKGKKTKFDTRRECNGIKFIKGVLRNIFIHPTKFDLAKFLNNRVV